MNVEEYKLRHGLKELPITFYFGGMFFWIFPFAAIVGLICRFLNIHFIFGIVIIIPWCVFWSRKAFVKWKKDKKVVER